MAAPTNTLITNNAVGNRESLHNIISILNKDETPFADLHGPGLRAVYDLADPDNSTFQLALGQSAHVLSPHYDDMQKLWQRFEGIRIVREPAGDTLTLMP